MSAPLQLRRRPDWDLRLHDCLTAAQKLRFRWGRHDCFRFVCKAIEAMTGTDPGAEFRGKYSSREEAEKVSSFAFQASSEKPFTEQVAEALAARCGFQEVGVKFAGRGDVVIMAFRRSEQVPELQSSKVSGETLKPCNLETFAFGLVDFDGRTCVGTCARGLERWPLAACRRAWRVAHA